MSREAQNEPSTSRYVGKVVTEWLRHDGADRLMELREPFTFVDSCGNTWMAPAGFIFDGTTIPRALWTVFGDPFIGDYRRAAVIHDLLCTPHCPRCGRLGVDSGPDAAPRYRCAAHPSTRLLYRVSSDDAARTFHEAMLCDGVSSKRASLMRRAVARWGPQFGRTWTGGSVARWSPKQEAQSRRPLPVRRAA